MGILSDSITKAKRAQAPPIVATLFFQTPKQARTRLVAMKKIDTTFHEPCCPGTARSVSKYEAGESIFCSPAIPFAEPRIINSVPKVTKNGPTFSFVTSNPFIKPANAPAATPTRAERIGDKCGQCGKGNRQ